MFGVFVFGGLGFLMLGVFCKVLVVFFVVVKLVVVLMIFGVSVVLVVK